MKNWCLSAVSMRPVAAGPSNTALQTGHAPGSLPASFVIIVLGDRSSGKTSLLERFASNRFPSGGCEPTIGLDIRIKNTGRERLQIWEVGASAAGGTHTPVRHDELYAGAHGVLVVYDSTLPASSMVLSARRWLQIAGQLAPPDACKMLIGNKEDMLSTDYHSQPSPGRWLADELAIPLAGCSALTGHGVADAFAQLVAAMRARRAETKIRFADTPCTATLPSTRDLSAALLEVAVGAEETQDALHQPHEDDDGELEIESHQPYTDEDGALEIESHPPYTDEDGELEIESLPPYTDEDGELEIEFGQPQWLPVGASSVFLVVESDNGLSVKSDPMDGATWKGAARRHDRHSTTLCLPCRRAASVTLHVMAESATQPQTAPLSIGGTTVTLPAASRHSPVPRRLRMLAPLDISIELSWIPAQQRNALAAPETYCREVLHAPQPRPEASWEPDSYIYKYDMYEWNTCGDSWELTPQESGPSAQQSRPTAQQSSRPSAQESRPSAQESRPSAQESRPSVQQSRPSAQESRPSAQES